MLRGAYHTHALPPENLIRRAADELDRLQAALDALAAQPSGGAVIGDPEKTPATAAETMMLLLARRTLTTRQLADAIGAQRTSAVWNALRTPQRKGLVMFDGSYWRLAEQGKRLSAALRQPAEQAPQGEPVAWRCADCGGCDTLCPHGRKDQPLYANPHPAAPSADN